MAGFQLASEQVTVGADTPAVNFNLRLRPLHRAPVSAQPQAAAPLYRQGAGPRWLSPQMQRGGGSSCSVPQESSQAFIASFGM